MKNLIIKIITILAIMLSTINASSDLNSTILKVGTKVAPPFAMKTADGKWEGISIELWREIAKKLHLKYEFKERNLKDLLSDVANKKLDLAISALTITAEREKVMDFSHTYYTAWLGIATQKKETNPIMLVAHSIFSFNMLVILLALTATLIVTGSIIWLTEKVNHPETFDANPIKGIPTAIWWVATILVPSNQDVNSPKTSVSKFFALLWLFVFLLIIATLIATISTTITQKQQASSVSQADLYNKKISTVKCSVSESYLLNRKVYPKEFETIKEALKELNSSKVDLMVYDRPILNYYINRDYKDTLEVAKDKFKVQNYSIALPQNSKLTEKINQALLEVLESPKWGQIKNKYLHLAK